MRKVKTFVHVFINSLIPQVSYYPKILHTKLVFSLKYYLALLLLLNACFLIFLPFKYYPAKIAAGMDSFIASLKTFPADLKITASNNYLVTNYNRPYFMWMNQDNRKVLLLAVDESGGLQKTSPQPLVLLTSNQLIINNAGKSSAVPIANLKITSIDKQKVDVLANTLTVIRNLMPLFLFALYLLLIILIPLGSIIINTLYILVASLIAFALFHFFVKYRIAFRKTVQISFHAITLPLVIDYALMIFRPTVYVANAPRFAPSTPFLFLILLSVFVFGGIYEAHWHHISIKK